MKTFSLVSLLLISLSLTFNLHAAVTVIHDWHMGESDPGIGNGDQSFGTFDSVGANTLINQPAGSVYPLYTNNVSGAAAFFAGSDLCIFYSGGQYAAGNVIPNLTTNFGMELWVYPTNGTGGQVIAYDGNTGSSGWGIYQSGANCAIFFGGILISTSVPLALNTWTEVALVCTNHVVGLNTTNVATLYTNGVPALTITNTPVTPAGNFLVAADNSGLETFSGAVDEVRVFTFGSGQFSPTNLLVNGPLVVTTTADPGAGALRNALAAAKAGSTITFAPNVSGQIITLANALPVNTSLTIDASALPGGIQINGNGAVTVFNIASGVTDVLNSLTITNGYTSSAGGGILNQGTLTLNQCTLSGNSSADNGGGINNGGRLTLNQCTLSGNSSQEGGGIFNDAFSTVTLNACTLSGNNASADGGGIVNFTDGSAEMTNTIIAGNNGSSGADLYCSGTNTYGGVNLVQFIYNNGTVSGPAPLTNAPNLAPLGNYGGPTQTMPPLPGSPAIGAGSTPANTFATDQRGYARIQSGLIDLGAVELPTSAPFSASPTHGAAPLSVQFHSTNSFDSDGSLIVGRSWNFGDGTSGTGQSPTHVYSGGGVYLPALVVTNSLGLQLGVSGPAVSVNPVVINNTADSGSGSLRVAITNGFGGETITFAPDLSGQTIMLGSTLSIKTNLTIDASALPGGIQINGNGAVTVFNIASGVTDVLNSLTIANGYTNGNGGGGINNAGRLTLNQCTLSGNSSQEGGGIDNEVFGTVTLNQCTLSRNTTSNGNGDGIYNDGLVTLNECTLSGNIETSGYQTCIVNNGTLDMVNSIVGNNGTLGVDIENNLSGTLNYYGANLVEEYSGQGGGSGIPIIAAPDLAPMGNYGGPTQTMPPLFGSPAVNAGSVADNTFTNDQRGYPRVIASQMDIGAVEGIYNASASVLTNATSLPNGSFQFGFTNYEDMTFNVFATTNLALPFDQWVNLGYAVGAPAGSGQFQFTDPTATNSPQRFYQVVSP